uniref:apolipoprotein L6 n=1 Tax=Jaculus jaculus TaxID=51337 RepID=UPI001E1B00DA|nr:apolipoprotein L6 [Jaculus jaculus]
MGKRWWEAQHYACGGEDTIRHLVLPWVQLEDSENHLTRKDVDWEREKMPGKQAATERKAGGDAKRDKDGNLQGEDVDLQDGDLSAEEREFLEQFSKWKKDQEVVIKELYALAEDIDANHKTMVKSNVAASSAAVASGVMSLLGLALAPATLGASMMLTVAGSGLGAAAGVARIVTDVWEAYRNRKARARASTLLPTTDQELEDTGGKKTSYVISTGQIVYNCGSAVDTIRKHARALRLARAHPHLATSARRLMTTGQVSTRSTRQVQKAFTGTALAMTKEARMRGGVTSLLSLGHDIAALSEEWKQLKEGTRAELAEELRAHARELEELVGECTQYYNKLWQKVRVTLWKDP